MIQPYRICTRCIMDTSDPEIQFDEKGVCNHCKGYDAANAALQKIDKAKALEAIVSRIKEDGKGKEYDCLIGLSGGVDSSYVAHLVKKLGLRPLAAHFDCGWNSETAVKNIEHIVQKLNIDLYTFVVDWEEMRDLQLAFFRASVANADTPTDHAFVAALFKLARKHKIKYLISGHNLATESILPLSWGYTSRDLRHLRAVHRRYGKVRLKKYPQLSFLNDRWSRFVLGLRSIPILNYVDYNKSQAMEFLQKELGWKYYGGKHYESVFTRFFQAYYLPEKFGFDKRKAHLSSLIVSGQITREQALEEMKQPTYPPEKLKEDKEFVQKKLGISDAEWAEIMRMPLRSHKDFGSNEWLFKLSGRIGDFLRSVRVLKTHST